MSVALVRWWVSRWSYMLLGYALVTAILVVIAGFVWWAIVIPFVVFHAYVADGVFRPGSQFLLPTITRGPVDAQQVALTFDDGPDPTYTPQIKEVLERHSAKATFFCIGRHLEAHSDIAQELIAVGHELGNHSFSHSRLLNFRTVGPMRKDIEAGAESVRRITGDPNPWYRPPVGLKNPALARIAPADGLGVVLWSLHSRESLHRTPKSLAQNVLGKIQAGDIVLFHDGCDRPGVSRQTTVEALDIVLEEMTKRGLTCVTVSQLLGKRAGQKASQNERGEDQLALTPQSS